MVSWMDEYRALTEDLGWSRLTARTQIELTGDDRAKFLHNLCTNNIRDLPVGQGCEAFLLSAQGKIVAHVLVFCEPNSLVLETVVGQGQRLIQHLDRYLIREKVTLHDRTGDWSEILLSGAKTEEWLKSQQVTLPGIGLLACGETSLFGEPVRIRRVGFAGPIAYAISGVGSDVQTIFAKLENDNVPECGIEAVEALRIENGFPAFGIDVTDKNLPQEIARDSLAISFTKGCYIGQETVARIDALGHVNRLLCGVRLIGDVIPEIGMELKSGEVVVGQVTSATFSPRLNSPLALAFLRRGQHLPEMNIQSVSGEGVVVALPICAA